MRSFLKKICYSGLIPKYILRFIDEIIFIPAMWMPSNFIRKNLNRLRGVSIGKGGWIGHGTLLGNHPMLLSIGDNVIFADGVKILTHDTSIIPMGGSDIAAEVNIANNIQIGENAVILPGVNIGNNCIIGAGAVVINNVPANTVYAGVPAKFICSTQDAIEKINIKIKNGQYFSTYK